MTPEEAELVRKRKSGFDEFYRALVPALVDFIGRMGVNPAHEVLKHADQFSLCLDDALQSMAVADDQDRAWLLTHIGYFIGEYFVQKYSGCWYVNEISGSRYLGRYVVGQFAALENAKLMLDPFEIAQTYVDETIPRQLERLLKEVDAELVGGVSPK
ncbi:hypothetical protein IGB42_01967 [Andreprevotia sp. IGB-42]|uniref:hypothetical protein n=1 Tax=Andreprevotia sp. IGB-42 TaxID=2497473 RepID=UPI001358BB59|nr:hypothetical protein [Andreprevotia sp. IGB-42]KAF0813616.1 hypothetical protein IGB42_01967 [Andreprevotia sp. IGB-42]